MKAHSSVAQHAFAVGLTSFIPIPILDEWLRVRFLQRSFAAVAAAEATDLNPAMLKLLAQDRLGFLAGCVVAIVWWPLRKLIRTVLYVLTVKEFMDWTCEGVLRAEMVRYACQTGALPSDPERVGRTMRRVMIAHPHSPVGRLLMFRKRPPMDLPDANRVTRFTYRMVQLGGGAVVLDAFKRGLANEE
jgi:hypothetical protein